MSPEARMELDRSRRLIFLPLRARIGIFIRREWRWGLAGLVLVFGWWKYL